MFAFSGSDSLFDLLIFTELLNCVFVQELFISSKFKMCAVDVRPLCTSKIVAKVVAQGLLPRALPTCG